MFMIESDNAWRESSLMGLVILITWYIWLLAVFLMGVRMIALQLKIISYWFYDSGFGHENNAWFKTINGLKEHLSNLGNSQLHIRESKSKWIYICFATQHFPFHLNGGPVMVNRITFFLLASFIHIHFRGSSEHTLYSRVDFFTSSYALAVISHTHTYNFNYAFTIYIASSV